MTQLTLHDECSTATKDTTNIHVPILGCIIHYNIAESTTELYVQNKHKYFQVTNNVLFRNKICILALRSIKSCVQIFGSEARSSACMSIVNF